MAEVTDIVERVARAIAIADAKPGQHPLLLTSENYMSATRKLARAALAAMLEAVGEPVAQGCISCLVKYKYPGSDNAWFHFHGTHRQFGHAMSTIAVANATDIQISQLANWTEGMGGDAETPLYSLAALREALPPPPQD